MVQQGRTGWRTQYGGVFPVFVRADDLRWQESGGDGDADGALLDFAAFPVLEGAWCCL